MNDTARDTAALELLGEQIWDTLTTAGHTPACQDPHSGDGFDVLGDPARPGEAVVVMRAGRALYGCPASGVMRATLGGFQEALEAAGWTVRRVMAGRRKDDFPVRLHVTRPPEAVLAFAAAAVRGAAASCGGHTVGMLATDHRLYTVTTWCDDEA